MKHDRVLEHLRSGLWAQLNMPYVVFLFLVGLQVEAHSTDREAHRETFNLQINDKVVIFKSSSCFLFDYKSRPIRQTEGHTEIQ